MDDELLLTTRANLDAQRQQRRKADQIKLSPLPEEDALVRGLTSVLGADDGKAGFAALTARKPNPYQSSFPSEVVSCRLDGGGEVHLLCKYGVSFGCAGHGSRGGIAFEATVYRDVLQPLGTSSPAYYGDYIDPMSGETWLVIEYVDGLPLSKASQDDVLEAARWIGRLHAAAATLGSTASANLHVYSAQYYQAWAERTALYTRQVRPDLGWVSAVCDRFRDVVPDLLSVPQTVIHGEYYPENVLVQAGRICPVDWQSTAMAAGEVDLASMTEGRWPEDLAARCELAYAEARWPDGAPERFEKTLEAARLYWPLRWLGESPEWTADESSRRHFDTLRSEAERLGIIPGDGDAGHA
jgi:hypothetical protein